MVPVAQSRFGGHAGGNCLAACVASLLDLSINDVPDFGTTGAYWFRELVDWCAARDIGVIYLPYDKSTEGLWSNVYGIECRPMLEANWSHCVVVKRDITQKDGDKNWEWKARRVHDPNPESLKLGPAGYILILQRN